jgi:ABC-type glycerol-3-phosphate transport system substrate-binding protein
MENIMNVRLVFSILITALVAACGGTDDTASEKRIRFWHFWSEPSQRAALEKLVRAFEAETGATVEMTELSWNDGKAKLLAAFSSNTAPDVVELGSDWVAQFSSAGVLMELPGDSAAIARFVDFSIPPGIWNGRTYAYPWVVDTRVWYANKSLLQRSGMSSVPQTLPDLLRIAEAIQNAGAAGVGTNGPDANRLYKKILPLMWTFGGDVLDARGKPVINSPANVQALEFYLACSRTGIIETQRQIDAAFVQGSVGFWNSGSWLISKLASTNVSYETFTMPGIDGRPGVSFAGGEYLAASQSTKQGVLARQFIRYMTAGKNAVAFCSSVNEAGFPAERAYFNDSSLIRIPAKAVFAKQLESARMTPVHPRWLDIQSVIEEAVVEALYGKASASEALNAAQDRLQEIAGN